MAIPRERGLDGRKEKGPQLNDAQPWLEPWLEAEGCGGLTCAQVGHLETFPVPSPCSQASWKLGGLLICKKQIPVASILGIFVSLSHRSPSFPESFTDSVSLLWNPIKSSHCYLPAQRGRNPSHLGLVCDACHLASLRCVGRSALCHTHLQNDWISGFLSKCL